LRHPRARRRSVPPNHRDSLYRLALWIGRGDGTAQGDARRARAAGGNPPADRPGTPAAAPPCAIGQHARQPGGSHPGPPRPIQGHCNPPTTHRKERPMTLYTVHLYREMRLTFERVEADTHEAAAAIARDRLTEDADDIEDCDGENLAALVDVVGDDQY